MQQSLRVATYNVAFGKDTAGIAGAFLENENLKNTDVIFFQEIEHHFADGI